MEVQLIHNGYWPMLKSKAGLLISAFLIFLGTVLGYYLGSSHSAAPHPSNGIYARFDGGVISEKEVEDTLHNETEAWKNAQRSARKKITEEKVRQRLLEIAAQAKHLSADQLLAQYRVLHINDPVSADELATYARGQGLDPHKLTAVQKQNFTTQIRNIRVMQLQNSFMDELYNNAHVKIFQP